eukprot:6475702-Amphidinium_carterae.1
MRRYLLVLVPTLARGFYLPGVAPKEYAKDAEVELKVNKLTSVKTQLPYNYYTLPYCKPDQGIQKVSENLGEILAGDLIENSPYRIKMRQNVTCAKLCTEDLDKKKKQQLKNMINDEYL